MNQITLKQITAEATHPIRHVVLRQGQPRSTCRFDGDELSSTLHFGLFVDDSLAGICSIYHKTYQYSHDENFWQIRGMAVLDEYRGNSFGEKLLTHAIEQVSLKDPLAKFWCNARLAAHTLYLRHGFSIVGEAFVLPKIGPHYLMVKFPPRADRLR